jgi:hypothetical protein
MYRAVYLRFNARLHRIYRYRAKLPRRKRAALKMIKVKASGAAQASLLADPGSETDQASQVIPPCAIATAVVRNL